MAKFFEPIEFRFFTKNVEYCEKSVKGKEKGFYVRGYASTSDIDRQDEVVTREALKKAEKDLMKSTTVFFEHNYSKPIGKITNAYLDEKGLFIEAYISKTLPNIRTLIEEGILNKFSIGGRVTETEPIFDGNLGKEVVKILGIELFEVSLVGVPANNEAAVVDYVIKSALKKAGVIKSEVILLDDKAKKEDKMEKILVEAKDIKRHEEDFIRKSVVIDSFLGTVSYKQRVLNKAYCYFKMALMSKALKEVSASGWKEKTIGVNWAGKATRPIYSYLETGRDKKEELLIDGFTFLSKGKNKLVVSVYPRMFDFAVDVYYRKEDSEEATKFIKELDDWSAANNFYKGEKINPRGHFLDYSVVPFEDIKIPEDKKKAIKVGALEFFKKKDIYTKNNLPFKRGLIFAGEPGTGKTFMGKALMSTTDSTFIWVTSDMVRWAEDVKYLFRMAKELAPCILFLEDIDDYLKSSRVIDTLKTQMDGLDSIDGIVTILCTNYPEDIPMALIDRPSRFDDIIKFDVPDENLRFEILDGHSKKVNIANREAVLKKIAKESDKLTGAHLKEIIVYSILLASDDSREEVTLKDLETALNKVKKTRETIASLEGSKTSKKEKSISELSKDAVVEATEEKVVGLLKARGDGQGNGGERQGDGGANKCVCPKCGKEVKHEKGTPCNKTKCPDCGISMVGKKEENKNKEEVGTVAKEEEKKKEEKKEVIVSKEEETKVEETKEEVTVETSVKEEAKVEVKKEPEAKKEEIKTPEEIVVKTSETEVDMVKEYKEKVDGIYEMVKTLVDTLVVKEEVIETEEKKEEAPEEKKEEKVEEKKKEAIVEKKEKVERKGVVVDTKEETDELNILKKKLENKTPKEIMEDTELFNSLDEELQKEIKENFKKSILG